MFDTLCTLTYNFDTVAYPVRLAYRANIQYSIERALALITLCYDYANHPKNGQVVTDIDYYNDVLDLLQQNTVEDIKQNNIFFYVIGYPTDSTQDYEWKASSTHSYNIQDGINGIFVYSTFSDPQKKSFIARLNGRTLREELTLANFAKVDDESVKSVDGFLLDCEDRDGGWEFWPFEKYKDSYGDMVMWDSNTISNGVQLYKDNGDKLLKHARTWNYYRFK